MIVSVRKPRHGREGDTRPVTSLRRNGGHRVSATDRQRESRFTSDFRRDDGDSGTRELASIGTWTFYRIIVVAASIYGSSFGIAELVTKVIG